MTPIMSDYHRQTWPPAVELPGWLKSCCLTSVWSYTKKLENQLECFEKKKKKKSKKKIQACYSPVKNKKKQKKNPKNTKKKFPPNLIF